MIRVGIGADVSATEWAEGENTMERRLWGRCTVSVAFVAVAALAVVGCAAGGSPSNGGTTTVTYWTHVNAPAQEVERALIAQYEDEHPDVRIEYLPIEFGTMATKLNAAIAAGGGPDLVNYFQSYAAGLTAKGYLAPVDHEAYGATAEELSGHYTEAISAGFSVEGDFIGIPHEISTYQFWVNDQHFANAGLDPQEDFPKTWADVAAVGAQLQGAPNGPVEGVALSLNNQVRDVLVLDAMTRQAGGSLFSPDGRDSFVDSPEAVRALQTWGDLANEYGVNDPALGPTASTNAEDLFGDGTAAMVNTGGSWFIPTLEDTYPDIEWTVGQYPTFGGEDIGADLYGYGLYVPVTSSQQEAAWEFARFLADASPTYFSEAGIWLGDNDVLSDEATATVPNWDVFVEGFERGNFLPPLSQYNEISQILESAIQRVVVNGEDAQSVLDAAQAAIEPLLDK